ncbi:Uncharacterized protein SCF082_LOCUS34741 [Durusdinium trenchii]|uniref:Uncharacterized protein n=1 Tax=Durusdinium trenchii TaxID=1381693 RepID=A0ABP0P3T1_9DINO
MDEWLSCNGEWRKSTLFKKMIERKTTSTHGARVWMTFQQIAEKYKSEEVARRIVEAKLADPELRRTQVKDHPDCPESEELRLYLVWESEGVSEVHDSVIEDIFQAVDGDSSDDEAQVSKKSVKKSVKKSASSASEGSDDDSDESDKKVMVLELMINRMMTLMQDSRGSLHPVTQKLASKYDKGTKNAIEYVDLPVKYLNEDGRIVVCTEPWPIIDVHSIMHFLIEEAGVEIPASDIRNYWARSKEHGERWAQDESNHHRGHKFQVVELRGDWQWHKKVFKFWECQWNSVKTMCPFCNAKGQSDNPSELYWNLDEPIYEFNLVEFLSQRMPPRGVCPLIGLQGFDPSIIRWCLMHTLHLGLLYTANGGTMQLGCTTGKFFHLFMISEETESGQPQFSTVLVIHA